METQRARRSAGLFAGLMGEVDRSLAVFYDTGVTGIARVFKCGMPTISATIVLKYKTVNLANFGSDLRLDSLIWCHEKLQLDQIGEHHKRFETQLSG